MPSTPQGKLPALKLKAKSNSKGRSSRKKDLGLGACPVKLADNSALAKPLSKVCWFTTYPSPTYLKIAPLKACMLVLRRRQQALEYSAFSMGKAENKATPMGEAASEMQTWRSLSQET